MARLYTSTYDLTWESQPVWILTGFEVNLAIVCASAPALKVYFQRYVNLTIFTKRSGLYPSDATYVGSGGNTADRSDRGAKKGKGPWSWSDRNTVDTQDPESEFHPSTFARENGPKRHNGGRKSPGPAPNDIPLEGVVVTTEVKTSISSPRRIKSYGSQESSGPLPRESLPEESLRPGIVYAGNYRRGKNL
jgi:hypothetical protein